MTSYDRHATYDSPSRSGQYTSSRHAPLTGISSPAGESRVDLTATDSEESNTSYKPQLTVNGTAPYSPGMRSAAQRSGSPDEARSLAQAHSGEIQMQNFSDGLPPPPPVSHSWKRIDRWLEDHYEELFDQIGEGCTQNDINELEHQLDCTLPMDVRESIAIHDGQERGGIPSGVIFGCMLLDCEEIVHEWRNWRQVNEQYLTQSPQYQAPQVPTKAFGAASSSNNAGPSTQQATSGNWVDTLQSQQDSQPPNAVQKAYAHPAWIPLARDWGGNCLAVDLAPGPAGRWGQVIIMGRDYDCKYVVARSWAAFLATVADDISTDKVFVVEESGELKLREFPRQAVEPAYLDILRWRSDQKHGRKPIKRRPNSTNGAQRDSPYGSTGENDRGRSPQRLLSSKASGKAPAVNKSRGAHISSPLARVAEEAPAAIKVHTEPEGRIGSDDGSVENLISTESHTQLPQEEPAFETETSRQHSLLNRHDDKENRGVNGDIGLGVKNIDLNDSHDGVEDMKTVDI